MRHFKYVLILLAFLALPAVHSQAQVAIGVQIGPDYGYYNAPPVCPYGYYPDYPFGCAPIGYWGPEWFADGVFIGAGPWYRWYYTHPRYYRGFYSRPYYRSYDRVIVQRDFDRDRFYRRHEYRERYFRDRDRGFRDRDFRWHDFRDHDRGHDFRGDRWRHDHDRHEHDRHEHGWH